jgi:DNA-binding LytR/AlgR family response regulator
MDPLNIIIVEDEALLALELEGLIEDAGHHVAGWATSSTQAKKLVDDVEADVAFVDVNLTDGPTGVDVAEYIAKTRGSMVVFMTANPKRVPDDFRGAVGVIAKPYTMHGLIAALRYLHEGVRRPPPVSSLPVGFTLAPRYKADWSPSGA